MSYNVNLEQFNHDDAGAGYWLPCAAVGQCTINEGRVGVSAAGVSGVRCKKCKRLYHHICGFAFNIPNNQDPRAGFESCTQ